MGDGEIIPYIEAAASGQDPREWYWALMDYGSHLKQSGIRNNSKSAHYTKQSKFNGSLRQVRGAILRELQMGAVSETALLSRCHLDKKAKIKMDEALMGLARDGLIMKQRGTWRIV